MSSIRRTIRLAALLVVTGVTVSPAQAGPIVNGGFETGNFTGFTTVGAATVETSGFGSGPVSGVFQALLTNESGAVSASELETFLGLAIGSLDTLGNGSVVNGSAIQQVFTAAAGDVLTLRWNFLTSESPSVASNDFAFVVLTSPATLAATDFVPFISSTTTFIDETGYRTFTGTIPATGTYRIGLGVTNVGDDFVGSGLLVDDIRLTAGPISGPIPASIPEPTGLITVCACTLAMTIARGRYRV